MLPAMAWPPVTAGRILRRPAKLLALALGRVPNIEYSDGFPGPPREANRVALSISNSTISIRP